MSARILVVDDVPANLKLLEARLRAEYFEVACASSGKEALEVCARGQADIILLDVMMPEMDGFEVCRRLKADPRTAYIPVIMVTALDQPADRVAGLEAGADDFLTKPVSDIALFTRVRSLVRLKMLTDELAMRVTSTDMGVDPLGRDVPTGLDGRILLVDDRPSSVNRITTTLAAHHKVRVEANPQEALFLAADQDFDLAIISLELAEYDGLRLCSQLRSLDRTRMLPILAMVSPDDHPKLIRGLDIGVNDYLMRPLDKNELLARVKTQVRRKRFSDRLRDTVQLTLEMAMTDGLTGLHNRRYLERHLATQVDQSIGAGKPLSVLILDIDHFKSINDTHGHDAGDEVLRAFTDRIRRSVRGIDLACRLGGEEFVVVMPDTDEGHAMEVGERLREAVATEAFKIPDGTSLWVTASIGVATLSFSSDTPQSMLKRADVALYRAKNEGRNRVAAAAA